MAYLSKEKTIEAIRKYADIKHSNGEQIEYVNGILKSISVINEQSTADVVEIKHQNPNDESCAICNSELDEAGAGGIWDLAAEICDEVYGKSNYMDEQDTIYNIIRNYIEQQNFCCNCGTKMDGERRDAQ